MFLRVLALLAAGHTLIAQIGIFETHSDVGTVLHPGTADYDAAKHVYRITGSGENIWATADAFHYVWKKISGDVSLTADIAFPTSTGEPHKKAVLMIRQSLDADSAYADAAFHVNGLTSLQWREAKGAATHEIEALTTKPKLLRITKLGIYFYMSYADEGEEMHPAGGAMRIDLHEPFYIGIGVSAHNKDRSEAAIFSNVEVAPVTAPPASQLKLYSTLETISVSSTDRRTVYVSPDRFEAPNWTRDNTLIFNGNGRLNRIPADGGKPEPIDTGFATRINNDHGISPDGKRLAISDSSQDDHKSTIYIAPIGGGTPRRVTRKSPSYWHGWSPDGKTLAYCAERDGNFDIYTVPAAGGEETRLTTAEGLDDGPEYSPDGHYIYFNSVRTGTMQIWRMKPDGSDQEQVTNDEYNNWFPHISPDGQRMVYLTYDKTVTGHPLNKEVMLRMMDLKDGSVRILAKLFGGQGTINVPSWSPDGKRLAFVS